MPKQKGAVTLRGKLGNTVYSDGKYGKQAKSAPQLTEEQKQKKRDLPQNKRTSYLNKLSSGIRDAVDYYADALMPGTFYSALASHFRNEKTNHRVLLLDELRDMEVHTKYQFSKKCPEPGVELSISKSYYTAEIEIKVPANKNPKCNSFYLQFILLVWNRDDNNCRHMDESTPWIRMKDKTAKYTTVKFKRTAKDTEYLFACRCVFGVNEEEYGYTQSGMKFLKTGTVTPEGKRLLEDKKVAKEAALREERVKEIVKEKPRLKLRDKK